MMKSNIMFVDDEQDILNNYRRLFEQKKDHSLSELGGGYWRRLGRYRHRYVISRLCASLFFDNYTF